MADEQEDFLQVFISHQDMMREFKVWVQAMGWHLEGPIRLGEEDPGTMFMFPCRSREEFHEAIMAVAPVAEEIKRRVDLLPEMLVINPTDKYV